MPAAVLRAAGSTFVYASRQPCRDGTVTISMLKQRRQGFGRQVRCQQLNGHKQKFKRHGVPVCQTSETAFWVSSAFRHSKADFSVCRELTVCRAIWQWEFSALASLTDRDGNLPRGALPPRVHMPPGMDQAVNKTNDRQAFSKHPRLSHWSYCPCRMQWCWLCVCVCGGSHI